MTLKKVHTVRIEGLYKAARTLDVTPQHLRLVIRGIRKSERLVKKAEALGIKLPIGT